MTTITITEENICEAIHIEWTTARKWTAEGDTKMSSYTWRRITKMLEGMWNMLNWAEGSPDETDELREAINLLQIIASEHSHNL